MAKTMISDVIVPELFDKYTSQRTTERSAFWQAGIVERSEEWDAKAAEGGKIHNMPFWNDLSGSEEVLNDSGTLTPGKIDAAKDACTVHNRGKAWSTNDMAGILAGSDPMGQIVNRVGDYWARRMQALLLSNLVGVFGAASMAANLAEIHSTSGTPNEGNQLNGTTLIDAGQKLGDAKSLLTAIAMHSAVEASLAKQELIDWVQDSEGKWTIPTFQGLRVIIDDSMPVETIDSDLVYTTYLFGQGAFAYGERTNPIAIEGGHGTWSTEFARSALAGDNYLINRKRFILHPRGIRWTDSVNAGPSPTNAEVANQANWVRAYDPKNIRIVKVTHNVL